MVSMAILYSIGCQVVHCLLLHTLPQHHEHCVQLCLCYMPDIYVQLCRSTVAGKTNPKAKTGTAALGSVRDWCHNYDLTKPTSLQDLSQSRAVRPAVLFPPLCVSQLCLLCCLHMIMRTRWLLVQQTMLSCGAALLLVLHHDNW